MAKWKPLLQESMVHPRAFWGLARQHKASDNDEWGLCTHWSLSPPIFSGDGLVHLLALIVSVESLSVCESNRSNGNGRRQPGEIIKWKVFVPQCAQVCVKLRPSSPSVCQHMRCLCESPTLRQHSVALR